MHHASNVPGGAYDVPIGASADVDRKPTVPFEYSTQIAEEFDALVGIEEEPIDDGRTNEQIRVEAPYDYWGQSSPINSGSRRSQSKFPSPGRSKRLKNNGNGYICTRSNTHTNNSSSSNNNNNISNNHLPPVVHNVGHHTNGHLNQEPNQSIPPYNNSNVYRGGGVLYHNQPMPGGGGYPNWEQHTFVGGNINQPLHRNPPNNMQWHENGPMPGGGGYPNGEYHHFAGGNIHQPLHRHTPNNMQSFGVGDAGGNNQQSMYPYPANNPPQYAERRGVGNHIQPNMPQHQGYPIPPMPPANGMFMPHHPPSHKKSSNPPRAHPHPNHPSQMPHHHYHQQHLPQPQPQQQHQQTHPQTHTHPHPQLQLWHQSQPQQPQQQGLGRGMPHYRHNNYHQQHEPQNPPPQQHLHPQPQPHPQVRSQPRPQQPRQQGQGMPQGVTQHPAPQPTLSSEQLRALLHPGLETRGRFKLRDCRVIKDSPVIGYKEAFNPAEVDALYCASNGMVANHIPTSSNETNRPPPKGRSVQEFGHCEIENMRTVYCKAKTNGCECKGQIYRVCDRNTNTKGLLYYELVNPETGQPYEHEGHNAFPEHSRNTSFALSDRQKEFVRSWGQGRNLNTRGSKRALCLAMINSSDIETKGVQGNDLKGFITAVSEYIKNCKRSNSVHRKLSHKVETSKTTSDGLYHILNHLKSDPGTAQREQTFDSSDDMGMFMLSPNGALANKHIKVHSHDHDGTSWTYIMFEYVHAPELAAKLVQMFPDGKVQLEMDFFMGVCARNDWQVGHIGGSCRDHKYRPVAMIITKSENHDSAGKLLTRAMELLKEAGGDGRGILVDGGKALDKAIGMENEARSANVLDDVTTQPDMLSDLLQHDHTATTAPIIGDSTESSTAEIDDVCDEIMEAFAGQAGTDDGDEVGRRSLEVRLKKLLDDHQLSLERCLAHITRNAGTRGGGWRGGKGSLCRALISSGCRKNMMQRILGVVFMMSNIPCGDTKTFEIATAGVLEKYDEYIGPYVRSAYFNGNPSCLGGNCSKTPGDMTSTQGCEARGGELKKTHREICEEYVNSEHESSNPLRMLEAAALDLAFNGNSSNPLANFAITPSRPKKFMNMALDDLRKLSKYKPPQEVAIGSRKKQQVRNIAGDWLYSTWTTLEGEEIAPATVLGKNVSHVRISPSTSRLLTSVKAVKKEKMENVAALPADAQPQAPTEKDLQDISALSRMLYVLPLDERKKLRAHLSKTRSYNTVERHDGEDVVMYLFRRAQRDPIDNAYDDMNNRKYMKKGTKKKGKKGKATEGSMEEVVEAELALDKDAGEVEEVVRGPVRKSSYKSAEIQIDGHGGVLEAALQDTDKDNNNEGHGDDDVEDEDEEKFERRRDRVIFGNELGDWRETRYDATTGHIHCNCKRFSYLGDCRHCVYVEILHLEKYPSGSSGLANEQWQQHRVRIIHNLTSQCSKLK